MEPTNAWTGQCLGLTAKRAAVYSPIQFAGVLLEMG
jgi:hypothetical protein